MVKTIYAVYTQYEPEYKYEVSLDSLWSTKEGALYHIDSLKQSTVDHIWIEEIFINCSDLHYNENEEEYKTFYLRIR